MRSTSETRLHVCFHRLHHSAAVSMTLGHWLDENIRNAMRVPRGHVGRGCRVDHRRLCRLIATHRNHVVANSAEEDHVIVAGFERFTGAETSDRSEQSSVCARLRNTLNTKHYDDIVCDKQEVCRVLLAPTTAEYYDQIWPCVSVVEETNA
jgi:hypothetical protein